MRVIEAKLYAVRDENKTSLFFVIDHNFQKYNTPIAKNGGVNPKWRKDYVSFSLSIRSLTAPLHVFCYDKDMILDDFVGLSTFKVETFTQQNESKFIKEWL
jgi:hypothetical protein